MSSSNCCFLTWIQISQEAGQIFPSLTEFSTVCCDSCSQSLWSSQWSKSRCFSGTLFLFRWSSGCWQLISGSSSFFKYSLNIWTFTVHILLKPGLENFECYFASMRDECSCAAVWAFFGIALLWDWKENWPFESCGHCWVFQMYWHIECSTLTASSFRIWNSSTGIPSPPLALFIVILHKAHLTLHSRMLMLLTAEITYFCLMPMRKFMLSSETY